MCGITALIGRNDQKLELTPTRVAKIAKCAKRGPEDTKCEKIRDSVIMGFHRLAINGFNDATAMQPLHLKECVLICNGEIYNWKKLYEDLGFEAKTGSDCEIIIHLYRKFGMDYTLRILDGVYAFVLMDKDTDEIIVGRDPYGVRPLFISFPEEGPLACIIASEMKTIVEFPETQGHINQVEPGTFLQIDLSTGDGMSFMHSSGGSFVNDEIRTETQACQLVRDALTTAVNKRAENTDREVACLLSGGLDSSLIAALLAKRYGAENLHTWSVGLRGSEDLRYAKIVAKHIGSQHHNIELSEEEFLKAIEEVIYAIESYDTTTVRASVGNWLVAKYIKEMSNAKVILNGDGSDEVCGGYLYFNYAPDEYAFDQECRRLLNDIHYFDVLRSDRSVSYHGLEARTPFLDRNFVRTYHSIPPALRCHSKNEKCEKYLLRKAFDGLDLLPKEILWRRKEAFSDGVSSKQRSWFKIIQIHALQKIKDLGYREKDGAKAEGIYYRAVFERYFKGNADIVPYQWMPRFVEAKDASARTLDVYWKQAEKSEACATSE